MEDDRVPDLPEKEPSLRGEVVSPPSTSSGLTWRQKARFASCLTSPMSCGSVLAFSKDVYILEMGASAALMGAFGTILAVWGPLCNPVAGYCMDRDLLVRCFPWATWGRRAPWFLTHCVIMAISTAAVYVPPSLDPMLLSFWYLGWGMVLCWVLSVLFNVFEAARAELYPTKEERSEVEAASKLTSGLGTVLGTLPQLVIAASASAQARGISSLFFLVVGVISLFALPVLRLARQVYDPEQVGSFRQELLDLMKVPVCRHFMMYRFVEQVLYSLVLGGGLYYFTVVDGLTGTIRSFYIVVLGFVVGIVTLCSLPCWTQFFRIRRPNVNVSAVCGVVTATGALAPVVLLIGRAGTSAPIGFLLWVAVMQATVTGQTFWRATALGWIVDEDCQAAVGRRRESTLVGGVALVSSIGSALGSGIVINGLAIAGLHFANCSSECSSIDDSDAYSRCTKACDERNITSQPETVRVYTKLLYYVMAPVLQLLVAWLAYSFPIHGERLEKIYQGQAERYAGAAQAAVAPPPSPAMAVGKPAWSQEAIFGQVLARSQSEGSFDKASRALDARRMTG